MKRMLIAGILCAITGSVGATDARGTGLQQDVLAALLMNDASAHSQNPNHPHSDRPAPATYAEGVISLGGGGGGNAASAASTSPPPPSQAADEQAEIQSVPPAPHNSAWRALLPGSIQ